MSIYNQLGPEQNCIACPNLHVPDDIDRMPEGPTSSRDGVRVMFSHQATPCPLDSPGIKANGGNAGAQEPDACVLMPGLSRTANRS